LHHALGNGKGGDRVLYIEDATEGIEEVNLREGLKRTIDWYKVNVLKVE